ncbi:MFS transporter [Streptomyces yatensis]|uniref:MFS transporter n=1 Tax=Streptomyces yatensis TaxID=155177 RepID=A0ABN2I3J4_9ACTN|nr:MFS transporter [Streptomyces yatensis]
MTASRRARKHSASVFALRNTVGDSAGPPAEPAPDFIDHAVRGTDTGQPARPAEHPPLQTSDACPKPERNACMDLDTDLQKRTTAKVSRRLVPLLVAIYFVSYLDRSNISFAKLQMSDDLSMTATTFGLTSGIFFIGYVVVEVPSNLALHRFGARKWIARIMITWGVISSLMGFVPNVTIFSIGRFLLGIAEAGLYPGILLYLTYWIPREQRARVTALFLLAIPLASVLGSPLSTWLMSAFDGHGILAGWRWMFVIEGLPAVVLAFVVWFALTDRPGQAKWLSAEEREWLTAKLAEEERDTADAHGLSSLRTSLFNSRVLVLCVIYFCLVFGQYALTFFLPTIVDSLGERAGTHFSLVEVGLISAVPYLFAAAALLVVGRHSDRTGERPLHVAIPVLVSAVAFAGALFFGSPIAALLALSVGAAGLFGAYPSLWQLPTEFLTGTAAAGGLALINSLGNIAGFAAPYATGAIADASGGSYRPPMIVMSIVLLAAAVLVIAIRNRLGTSSRPASAALTPTTTSHGDIAA